MHVITIAKWRVGYKPGYIILDKLYNKRAVPYIAEGTVFMLFIDHQHEHWKQYFKKFLFILYNDVMFQHRDWVVPLNIEFIKLKLILLVNRETLEEEVEQLLGDITFLQVSFNTEMDWWDNKTASRAEQNAVQSIDVYVDILHPELLGWGGRLKMWVEYEARTNAHRYMSQSLSICVSGQTKLILCYMDFSSEKQNRVSWGLFMWTSINIFCSIDSYTGQQNVQVEEYFYFWRSLI